MKYADFFRFTIIAFISSILITLMLYIVLSSFKIGELIFVAAFFGMYVFAGYGINLLVDNEVIPNNYSRFLLAIIFIIIYSIVFVYMMPMLYGPEVISTSNTLASWGYSGAGSDIVLNKEFFLTLFAIIVLIVNYLDYRK